MSWFAYVSAWTLGLAGAVLALADDPDVRFWLLVAVGLAYLAVLVLGSARPQWGFYLPSLNRGPAQAGTVALTFDDGPDPEVTPGLLDLLRQEDIQAAFFFVAEAAAKHPALVRRAAGDGHVIGNHSFSHRATWPLGRLRGIQSEWERANQVFFRLLRRTPRLLRLPFGVSRPGLARVLKALNLTSIGWDVRGLEGVHRDPQKIAQSVAAQARNGSIILLHECYYKSKNFGPAVLETACLTIRLLRERGFTFSRLDRLLELPAYAEET